MILTLANRVCAGAGTTLVVAQMLLICADIALRSAFSAPIAGVPELVELAIVALVFLQIPNAVRTDAFIRSDGLFHALARRRPMLGRTLDTAFSLVGAAVMAVIAYGMWFKFTAAVDRNLFTGNPGLFTAPIWPALLCIVIGATLGCLNYLVRGWSAAQGRTLMTPEGP
ncbi:TRAP transporter small permease [Pseudooceanicola aestuarii]|uniref:TRAP transporter small permease n=1 Tax=Pseudooceanicola aestuarii TaxID=2697319 RepID=UPI0013D2967D|nr:TRAP transporter small permease [Pseudooceanicola aestuarii]